jgi:hypothetical protein
MRRLETDTLIMYYPARRRALAERTAARIAACQRLAQQRTQIHSWAARAKPIVVMPETHLNNAFVFPRFVGYEPIAVVPEAWPVPSCAVRVPATSYQAEGLPPPPSRLSGSSTPSRVSIASPPRWRTSSSTISPVR